MTTKKIQVLLRPDEKRTQFLLELSKDFDGVQNTDRINFLIDKVPVLQKQLKNTIIDNNYLIIERDVLQSKLDKAEIQIANFKSAVNIIMGFN